jgi:hypothetical protein
MATNLYPPNTDLISVKNFSKKFEFVVISIFYQSLDFINSIKWHIEQIELFNTGKNKAIALSEVGANNITVRDYDPVNKKATDNETESANWWTEVLLKSLIGKNLAYLLVWRNPCRVDNKPQKFYADLSEFYAPFILKGWNTKNPNNYNPALENVQNTNKDNFGSMNEQRSGLTDREERSVTDFIKLLKSRLIFLKK